MAFSLAQSNSAHRTRCQFGLCGDFINSYVMAKMKVWTEGRHLWTRTIGSTAVGQLVDSALFYPIAFFGTWQPGTMMKVIAFN